jgi:hypothetical protein
MSSSDTSEIHIGGRGPGDKKNIVLIVSAPNTPDSKHMPFKTDLTVGAAAQEAAEKFGYAVGGTPSFRTGTNVLDRNITLADAGLKNLDEVDLVSAGGGV